MQGAHTHERDHSPNRERATGTPGPQAHSWDGGTAASGGLGQEESMRKVFWVACPFWGVRENGLLPSSSESKRAEGAVAPGRGWTAALGPS